MTDPFSSLIICGSLTATAPLETALLKIPAESST
jgi:hypothetical protein